MANKKDAETKRKERHYPRCLTGRAAHELKWLFQIGPSLVGIGHRSPKPAPFMASAGSGDVSPGIEWNETRYDPTDTKLRDAEQYRRIDEGFQKLTPKERAHAAAAFAVKRRAGELRQFFGGLENLAIVWPTVLEALRKERAEATLRACDKVAHSDNPSPEMLAEKLRAVESRLSDVEPWLVRRIATEKEWAETIRSEIEAATAAVVTAYELVRTPTAAEKNEAKERTERKGKRRSPLERVRNAVDSVLASREEGR